VEKLAITVDQQDTFSKLVLFSTSNNHWYGTSGPNFSTVADWSQLIIDKNNIFVAASSKADDVAAYLWN